MGAGSDSRAGLSHRKWSRKRRSVAEEREWELVFGCLVFYRWYELCAQLDSILYVVVWATRYGSFSPRKRSYCYIATQPPHHGQSKFIIKSTKEKEKKRLMKITRALKWRWIFIHFKLRAAALAERLQSKREGPLLHHPTWHKKRHKSSFTLSPSNYNYNYLLPTAAVAAIDRQSSRFLKVQMELVCV